MGLRAETFEHSNQNFAGVENVPGTLWRRIRRETGCAAHIARRAYVCRTVSRRVVADSSAPRRRAGEDQSQNAGLARARFYLLPVFTQPTALHRLGDSP